MCLSSISNKWASLNLVRHPYGHIILIQVLRLVSIKAPNLQVPQCFPHGIHCSARVVCIMYMASMQLKWRMLATDKEDRWGQSVLLVHEIKHSISCKQEHALATDLMANWDSRKVWLYTDASYRRKFLHMPNPLIHPLRCRHVIEHFADFYLNETDYDDIILI